jgi:hypothetical protein
MKIKRSLAVFALLAVILTSCQTPTPVVTPTEAPKGPTATPEVTIQVVTNTATATVALPTSTPIPLVTATSLPGTLPDYSATTYLDDRSSPAALILSYANAINRYEYLRAYSYWTNPNDYLGTLDTFTASFNNITGETISMGQITSDGAAGSIYYSVPAAVTDTINGGGVNKYAVCFVLRMPEPGNYGAPPIQPMHFFQQTKIAVDAAISDANVIAAACTDNAGMPGGAPSVENLGDLSLNNYIDNRSGGLEVVSSMLNAINRKEYVRAYSYWQNNKTSYTDFANGYSDTDTVTATFGTVTSDAGAGQFYYKVPVAEYVTHTDSSKHIYVGCYTMHLANPGMQGTLPFEPLGITEGKFKEYPAGTDVNPLLGTVCQ